MANITITQNGANSQVNVNDAIGNKIIIDISDKELIGCSLVNKDGDVNWHNLSLKEKERIVNALTSITNMFRTSYNRIKQNNNEEDEDV